MSKGIFTVAPAALAAVLALFIGTTAAEAGSGGASRGTCHKTDLKDVKNTKLTAADLVGNGLDIGQTLSELLDDKTDVSYDRKLMLHKASAWAAKTQKNGPLVLLDSGGCEWKVSTGKDLIALWSIAPDGVSLYDRPVTKDGSTSDNQTAAASPTPMAIRIADTSPVPNAPVAAHGGQQSQNGGGSKSAGGGFFKNVISADTGEDLVLRQLGRLKESIDGPSLSVGPPKSGSHASYDYEFKGALGYKFSSDCSNIDQPKACTGVVGNDLDSRNWMLVPVASVWYGTEKSAAGSGSLQIDRFSAGTVLAVAFDLGANYGDGAKTRREELLADSNSAGFVLQVIPQFITDHRFESKIAYVEARTDITHLPDDLPFPPFSSWCFGDQFDGFNNGNFGNDGWGNVTCSAGAIMDYAHQFRGGITSGLTNSFSRLGFDVGASFKPVTDCDGSAFSYCDFAKLVSFQVGYRNLWDYSDHRANVYRFTSSLKFTLPATGGDDDSGGSGKGPSISITYTDGIEDITLVHVPTWKVSFSTGN